MLIAASYVSIGRILIGNIEQYRTNIESRLAEVLSTKVSIGSIEGDWSYLDPSLVFTEVGIGASAPIRLAQISIDMDTIATLREGSLVIKGFSAAGVHLTLKKSEGKWGLEGLPRSDRPFNIQPVLTSLKYLSTFALHDLSVQVEGQSNSFLIKSDPARDGELQRLDGVKSLALPLLLVDKRGEFPFLLGGKYEGNPGERDSSSDIYLKLPLLPALDFFPNEMMAGIGVRQLFLGGEFWLTQRGDVFELTGQSQINASFTSNDRLIESSMTFVTQGIKDGDVVAHIEQFRGDYSGASWLLENIGIAYEPGPDGARVALQVPELIIGELALTAIKMSRSGLLMTPMQLEILENLAPKGAVRSLLGVVQLGEELDFTISGQLEAVSIESYKALPIISDLSGFVSITPRGGFFDMVNERPFSLQFPGLFESPWYFDSAKTRVEFDISKDEIQAQSGLVQAQRGELIAMGRFHLRLPGDPLQTTWGLELGVQHAELLDAFRYIPNTLKEDVRLWLQRAVLSGTSNESGMVFHGSLAKQADKNEKSHQLYFEVTDTILDYDANWPRFDDLAATIFLDNFEISSKDAVGQIFDSEVFESQVLVPISIEGVADTILIDGRIRGSFTDGLRMLTETPLLEATNAMAQGWLGTGAMTGIATMNIPLGARTLEGEPTLVDLKLDLEQVDLDMPGYELQLREINGEFRYESNSAIQSDHFSARLFDEAVRGSMSSTGDINGGEIVINLDGVVASSDLYQWADQPLLSRATGSLQYRSDLHIFYGNRSQEPIFIRAESKLKGVELNLPRPLAKMAAEELDLEYKQIFLDAGYRIEVSLGEEIQANLKILDGTLAGGRVHFGHELIGDIAFKQLRVSGALAHIVYEEWDQLILDLEQISEGSMEEELVETLDAIEVTIGLFDVFGFEIENVLTKITRSPDAWHVDLSNEWLQGGVSVSDDDAVPIDIAMQKLIFESDLATADKDPLAQVSPSELTAARFSVEQLLLDGEDYGAWSFLYQPDESGARLDELKIDVRGIQVADDASVRWQLVGGQHRSHFAGTLLVPDLAYALQQWGYASSIEGEDFRLYGDVAWPGTPAMVDLDTINGLVRLNRGEGRFVQADSNMGALRLLGMFDFASIAKRFRLDFSDVLKSGFSFNSVKGEMRFKTGFVDVVDPILIEGAGSTFKVAGRVNLLSGTLDNDMIVTLPVNRNLPWYAAFSAIATGPVAGAGVFLAQKVFQNQINTISSAKYKITGSMDEPVIEFVTIFSDTVRKAPVEPIPIGE